MSCPDCGNEFLSESKTGYICPKCGVVGKVQVVAKTLNLDIPHAKVVFERDEDLQSIHDANPKYPATFKGNLINGLTADGQLILDFPCLFPSIPGGDTAVITDRWEALDENYPGLVYYSKEWLPLWGRHFTGKKVTVLISSREVRMRAIADSLAKFNAIVFIGYLTDSVKSSVESATPIVGNPLSMKSVSKKGKSLRDVIDHFHMGGGRNGSQYKHSINVPMRDIVDSVIEWFTDNGTTFVWDEEGEQGYLKFQGRLFKCAADDKPFKSLLRSLGGITAANNEGRAIIDGLCSMEGESVMVKPETWIKNDIVEKTISIRQGGSKIFISKDSVTIEEDNALTYDMIQGARRWFTPIKLIDTWEGLDLLFKEIVPYFTLPDAGKELLICWLFGIFLKDFSSIRPGVRVSGQWTSGKSTVLQSLYWLFYGKAENELTVDSTTAALWRWAATEPFLPLDNKNVKALDENLRTFLDGCATGGRRNIAVSGSGTEFRSQKTHTFIMISGLDEFPFHDVRTRYYEVTCSSEFKSSYYPLERRETIFRSRDKIFSSVFKLISTEVLPNISQFLNQSLVDKYRVLLGSKERTVDYFLIMLAIGTAFQKKGFIPSGDLGERWSTYITENARRADIVNADVVEWMRNFRMALSKEDVNGKVSFGISNDSATFDLLTLKGKVIGLRGTYEEVTNCLAWAAAVLRRKLPWSEARAFKSAVESDENALKGLGWDLNMNKESMSLVWGE
jgi:hypothetical protein